MDKPIKKKSFLSGIKSLKHKEVIIAILAVAVMLAIYFSSYLTDKKEAEVSVANDYCAALLSDVTDGVKKLSGDKKASVIIHWKSSIESVIAYQQTVTDTSESTTPTVIKNEKPIVLKEVYPEVKGVAIVVKGAENVKLRLDIIGYVSTLLAISPEKVAVYAAK